MNTIKISTEPLPQPNFDAGANGRIPGQPVHEITSKTDQKLADQQAAIARNAKRTSDLSRWTSSPNVNKPKFNKWEIAGAAVVTMVLGAGLGLAKHNTSKAEQQPIEIVTDVNAVNPNIEVGSVEAFQQAQALLDPTNPDAAARQQAEEAAQELMGAHE